MAFIEHFIWVFVCRNGLIFWQTVFFSTGDFAYYSGGYITKRYGRDDFDAIQVETPRDLRIESGEEGREHLGHALGMAISDFFMFHYNKIFMTGLEEDLTADAWSD